MDEKQKLLKQKTLSVSEHLAAEMMYLFFCGGYSQESEMDWHFKDIIDNPETNHDHNIAVAKLYFELKEIYK